MLGWAAVEPGGGGGGCITPGGGGILTGGCHCIFMLFMLSPWLHGGGGGPIPVGGIIGPLCIICGGGCAGAAISARGACCLEG